MANLIPPMLVQIQADVSDLKTGLAQAETAIKGVDDQVATASTGMANFTAKLKSVGAAMGIAFAGQQLAQFTKDAVMSASTMNESVSKVQVVFGETSAAVLDWGKNAATTMGLSNQKAIEAAGTYGNLFQAIGITKDKSQEMSTTMVQLAADLASFNNTSVDEALNALRSGVSGETEPLKRFGVALNDATLKQKALSMGLIESTSGVLPPAIKAQATYALLMEQTTLAQGDYARTSAGTANTIKTLQAKFADASVAVGNMLLPALNLLLKVASPLVAIMEKMATFVNENKNALAVFAVIITGAATAWGIYELATNRAKIATAALNLVQKANPMMLIVTAVALAAAGLVVLWNKSEDFRKVVVAVGQAGVKAIGFIIEIVGLLVTSMMNVVTGPLRLLLKGLAMLGNKEAKDALKSIDAGIAKTGKFFDDAAKKVRNYGDELGKLSTVKTIKTPKITGSGGSGDSGVTGGSTGNGGAGLTAAQIKAQEKLDKAAADALEKHVALVKKYADQVEGIYDDMNTAIADAQDKANTALENRDEKIASAKESYLEKITSLQETYNEKMGYADDAYMEANASAHERFAEVKENIEKDYADKIKNINVDLADKKADIISNAGEAELSLREKYVEKSADLTSKATDKIKDLEETAAEKIKDLKAAAVEKLLDLENKYNAKIRDLKTTAKEKLETLETAYNAKIKDLNETAKEKLEKLETDYNEKIVSLKSDASEKLEALEKKFLSTVSDLKRNAFDKGIELEKAYALKISDVREAAAEKALNLVKDSAKKQADIIQQSVDRLRNAFSSGVGTVSIADAFAPEGGGADKLLADLRTKLQSAKELQANAGALAGMGYSQTFIEEVVKNGPEAGNAIAVALKNASPAANAEMVSLYNEINTISAHGLDTLASGMNTGANLATEELRVAYAQVSVDLANSLSELNATVSKDLGDMAVSHNDMVYKLALDLADSLAKTNVDYKESIDAVNVSLLKGLAEAKAALDAASAETNASLVKDLASSKSAYDAAIVEINKTLLKDLADSKDAYDTAVAETNKTLNKNLEDTKTALDKKLAETRAALAKDLLDAQTQLDKDIASNTKKMNDALADAQKAHDKAITQAEIVRTEALAAAELALKKALEAADKALTTAQEKAKKDLDKAMIDAEKILIDALTKAQKDYEDSIAAIDKATTAKIAALKIKLQEVADLLTSISEKQAAADALTNSPVFTPVVPVVADTYVPQNVIDSGSNGSQQTNKGTVVNINAPITNYNTTTEGEMSEALVNAVKYGLAVI